MSWFGDTAQMAAPTFVNQIAGQIGLKRQYKYNKRAAQFQHDKNMELLKYQLDYNSPSAQMGRFKDAGLNPNLVYGQGSPGNMDSVPKYPDVAPPDVQAIYGQLGTQFQQSRLLKEQADLTRQRVQESGIKQDLMKAQKDLVKANPYLNKEYVNAMVLQLQSTARIKENEANVITSEQWFDKGNGKLELSTVGYQRIMASIEAIVKRNDLMDQDAKIKAEILKSKQFQNELSEIQLNWLKDGDITPQHIYLGIMMLIQKLF